MDPQPDRPKPDRPHPDKSKPPVLDIDPATLVLIVSALILIPLIVTGFISQ